MVTVVLDDQRVRHDHELGQDQREGERNRLAPETPSRAQRIGRRRAEDELQAPDPASPG